MKVIKAPGMTEQLLAQGAEPIGSSPQEFDAYLRTEIDRWTKLIVRANIRSE